MTLEEYQEFCKTTSQVPPIFVLSDTPGLGIEQEELIPASYVYTALGLAGEAGEVVEKIKKIVRNQRGIFKPKDKEALKKEMGDVLWYLSDLCNQLEMSLQDVMESNVEKLSSRLERNVIRSEGDDR